MLEDNYRHKGLRSNLVSELQQKGISDQRVLKAMDIVPRHFFMDSAFLSHSYQDKAFGIGEGQTISQPYTVAFQTALLQIKKSDNVLEIGTGSGYQAAILMSLGANLTSIEYNKNLHLKAKKILQLMNFKGRCVFGDGSKGYPNFAPYHKILVTAGAPTIPTDLINQLTIGGMLVIPVGDAAKQKMLRLTKISDTKVKKEAFGDFSFVKLIGENGWKNE